MDGTIRRTIVAAKKYVVSSTLERVDWNAELVRGDCFDNAVVESFFPTLKVELVSDMDWADHRTAQQDLFEFIEVWYNRQRRHSTLGYLSPVAYEENLVRQANAA